MGWHMIVPRSFGLSCILAFYGLLVSGSAAAQSTPLSDLDALRYIASHPDLIQAYGADPARGRSHYETWGIREGRKITFEPLYYTASHPDLIEAFRDDELLAVTHYVKWGYKEQRQTTFSPLYALRYIASSPDLIVAFGPDAAKGVRHYVRWGYFENKADSRSRRISFEPLCYTASHPDLITAFGIDELKSVSHYIQWGYKENRQVTFCPLRALIYIASSPDLIEALGADALKGARHYVQWGYFENQADSRNRNFTFNPALYLLENPDLQAMTAGNPEKLALHYITSGYKENRGNGAGGIPSVEIVSASADGWAGEVRPFKPPRSFDGQFIGSESSLETFFVFNRGERNSQLKISEVKFIGDNADQFNVFSVENCSAIRVGDRCAVRVAFKPTRSGYMEGRLRLTYNAPYSPYEMVFTGTGIQKGPSLSPDPKIITFGGFAANESQTATVSLRNSGNEPLVIERISIGGIQDSAAVASQKSNCKVVAVGSVCVVEITYTRLQAGASHDIMLAVDHSLVSSEVRISRQRALIPIVAAPSSISVSPSAINFERTTVNSSTKTQVVTVTNTGSVILSVSGVVVSGTDASQFMQTNNCSAVTSGRTCTISVTFRPTSNGNKNAALIISHNAAANPSAVTVFGEATTSMTSASMTRESVTQVSMSPASLQGVVVSESVLGQKNSSMAGMIGAEGNYSGASVSADSMTGSSYRLIRSGDSAGYRQTWRLEYRDSGGTLLSKRTLPDTVEVSWRRSDLISEELATTGWARVCSDRVWTIQDGYQLLFQVGSQSLTDLQPGELFVNSSAEATVIANVGCASGGAVRIEGYSLGVSEREPPLRSNSIPARHFIFVLDRNGAVLKRDVWAEPFDLVGLCRVAANEQRTFCNEAGMALAR